MLTRCFARAATLVLVATAPQGCDREPTMPGGPPVQISESPTPLVSVEWQEQARTLVGGARMSALAGGRVYAALSVAQYRAIKDADRELPPDEEKTNFGFEAGGRSRYETRRGAVAAASERVLSFLFPASAGALEQILAHQAKTTPGLVHPDFTRGAAIGRSAGDAMVVYLQNDGFTRPWTGTVPTGPDKWIPNTLPPGGGTFGGVKPYYMATGSQFRPAPPPAFGSAAFNTDLNEIVTMTQNRTPEQLASAKFWDYPAGSPTPIGHWNSVAATYVEQHNLDERAATQVFSIMHAAVMDALIGCWDAKYYYWLIRPSQANSAISLAFAVPNFPAYPSGHSCASASAGRVLTHFFPSEADVLVNQVSEAGLSRMYAGIHFRFDVTAGQALGRAVAELALSRGAP